MKKRKGLYEILDDLGGEKMIGLTYAQVGDYTMPSEEYVVMRRAYVQGFLNERGLKEYITSHKHREVKK